MTEKIMTEKKTLKELLNEDGFSRNSDAGIIVHDGLYGCLAVSHRYLAGGWDDVLSAKAERIHKGEYVINKEA